MESVVMTCYNDMMGSVVRTCYDDMIESVVMTCYDDMIADNGDGDVVMLLPPSEWWFSDGLVMA